MELELLTGQTLGMLVMDFALVFAVLLLVRVIYGVASGVDTMHEISVKDNFAVGVSLAGATAAIGIMLTGVVSGEFAFSYGMEIAAMASYGALGLVLMWLTRLIFDRIALPHLSVRAEIGEGNIAVALRFIGFQVGVALAVTAAGGLAPYVPAGDPVMQALVWGLVSIGAAVVLVILTLIAEFAVLTGLDLSEEVDRQRNIGVALVEVAVYLAIGLLLLNHLA